MSGTGTQCAGACADVAGGASAGVARGAGGGVATGPEALAAGVGRHAGDDMGTLVPVGLLVVEPLPNVAAGGGAWFHQYCSGGGRPAPGEWVTSFGE